MYGLKAQGLVIPIKLRRISLFSTMVKIRLLDDEIAHITTKYQNLSHTRLTLATDTPFGYVAVPSVYGDYRAIISPEVFLGYLASPASSEAHLFVTYNHS